MLLYIITGPLGSKGPRPDRGPESAWFQTVFSLIGSVRVSFKGTVQHFGKHAHSLFYQELRDKIDTTLTSAC